VRAVSPALSSLGARLRGAGLTPRALEAWAGTPRIAALPARLEAGLPSRATPAAAMLALFVGGAEIEAAELRLPAELVDELIGHELLERDGQRIRARVAILPLGPALVACDRLDAPIERELVCWPDDSSHHLAAAIPPGRRADWLDLGCGSAVAPLARPELATRITGIDINPRAIRYAELGAALSGISHLAVAVGDIGGDVGEIDAVLAEAELVTCNAPIPDVSGEPSSALPEVWRRADPGFFDRLWPALLRAVRPGGLIVVHAAREAILAALGDARGERVVVSYTPDGVRGFAVAWWRPDGPEGFVVARRELTPERPHLEPRDREQALGR
jgi:SAM-dependent methyltransferase